MRESNGKLIVVLAGCTAAFGLAGVSAADSVTMKRVGYGEGVRAQLTVNGTTFNQLVGASVFQISGGTGIGASMTGVHQGFSLAIPSPTAPREIDRTYLLSGLSGTWATLTADQSTAVQAAAGAAGSALYTSRDAAAAFQLALWEITSDFVPGQASSLNMATGSFRARGLDGSELTVGVSTWLDTLFTAVGQPAALANGLIGAAPEASGPPPVVIQIPLPSAVWAGLAGLAAIAVARRRKLI